MKPKKNFSIFFIVVVLLFSFFVGMTISYNANAGRRVDYTGSVREGQPGVIIDPKRSTTVGRYSSSGSKGKSSGKVNCQNDYLPYSMFRSLLQDPSAFEVVIGNQKRPNKKGILKATGKAQLSIQIPHYIGACVEFNSDSVVLEKVGGNNLLIGIKNEKNLERYRTNPKQNAADLYYECLLHKGADGPYMEENRDGVMRVTDATRERYQSAIMSPPGAILFDLTSKDIDISKDIRVLYQSPKNGVYGNSPNAEYGTVKLSKRVKGNYNEHVCYQFEKIGDEKTMGNNLSIVQFSAYKYFKRKVDECKNLTLESLLKLREDIINNPLIINVKGILTVLEDRIRDEVDKEIVIIKAKLISLADELERKDEDDEDDPDAPKLSKVAATKRIKKFLEELDRLYRFSVEPSIKEINKLLKEREATSDSTQQDKIDEKISKLNQKISWFSGKKDEWIDVRRATRYYNLIDEAINIEREYLRSKHFRRLYHPDDDSNSRGSELSEDEVITEIKSDLTKFIDKDIKEYKNFYSAKEGHWSAIRKEQMALTKQSKRYRRSYQKMVKRRKRACSRNMFTGKVSISRCRRADRALDRKQRFWKRKLNRKASLIGDMTTVYNRYHEDKLDDEDWDDDGYDRFGDDYFSRDEGYYRDDFRYGFANQNQQRQFPQYQQLQPPGLMSPFNATNGYFQGRNHFAGGAPTQFGMQNGFYPQSPQWNMMGSGFSQYNRVPANYNMRRYY